MQNCDLTVVFLVIIQVLHVRIVVNIQGNAVVWVHTVERYQLSSQIFRTNLSEIELFIAS